MMAQTPEAAVKKKVDAVLKELGAYACKPVTGGYGASGVPDIIACYQGKFYGIECKAGKNRPTALQTDNLVRIAAAGGVALVIDENNVENLKQFILESYK
jgi:Holliday junction resolvase